MIEFMYGLLKTVGFAHPLHPAVTHIPMGMIMGAFFFRAAALFLKMDYLAKSAYYCVVLAIIGIPPTVFFGITDWQHKYGGEWEALIIYKMSAATVLTIVLGIIIKIDKPEEPAKDVRSLLYLVALMIAISLGFSGGELMFG